MYTTETIKGANYQSFEFVPLLTLVLPTGDRLNFQFTDRDPILLNGIYFSYLSGAITDVSGSSIPFSSYRYRMSISNTNTSANMTNRGESNTILIPSLLDLIDANDGLRKSIISVYYYYPSSERLDRVAMFRVDESRISDNSIMLELLVHLDEVI
jgi:hypothetical protein